MFKYVGGGFLVGVPARDLSEEEVANFDKKQLLKSGLYVEVKEPKKKVELVEEEDYGRN